jgi:hypothetical protein
MSGGMSERNFDRYDHEDESRLSASELERELVRELAHTRESEQACQARKKISNIRKKIVGDFD